jgi:hypothetical protein
MTLDFECKSLNRAIDEGFYECYIEDGSKIRKHV